MLREIITLWPARKDANGYCIYAASADTKQLITMLPR